MVGSDWPVCTLAGSYDQVISLVAHFTSQLSKDEQRAIWELNPKRFYAIADQENTGKEQRQHSR